jgi:bisphosphoglycerate-dependent phosphoglycerate mutase
LRYSIWKGKNKPTTKEDNNKSTIKEDYRQYNTDLNNEFAMEEAFNKRFPNYALNEDLDQSYDAQKDAIFKDFIKFGAQLVESYEVRGNETSGQEETDLVENDLEGNE